MSSIADDEAMEGQERSFVIEYKGSRLRLAPGEFTIGRDPTCEIALRDDSISRRHALLVVARSGVRIKDLGSRNGIQVGSQHLPSGAETSVSPGSTIVIGRQTLVLHEQASTQSRGQGRERPDYGAVTAEHQLSDTVTWKLVEVLVRLGAGALQLGEEAQASRIGEQLLAELSKSPGEDKGAADGMASAGVFLVGLAELTEDPKWIEGLFTILRGHQRMVGMETVDELHRVVRRLRYPNPVVLIKYVRGMNARGDTLSAPDRFTLSRLKGVAKMLGVD